MVCLECSTTLDGGCKLPGHEEYLVRRLVRAPRPERRTEAERPPSRTAGVEVPLLLQRGYVVLLRDDAFL
jgi:hypothetical protein